MEKYYIVAYRNGGMCFSRVKESELEIFKKAWENILFIMDAKDFTDGLCFLI